MRVHLEIDGKTRPDSGRPPAVGPAGHLLPIVSAIGAAIYGRGAAGIGYLRVGRGELDRVDVFIGQRLLPRRPAVRGQVHPVTVVVLIVARAGQEDARVRWVHEQRTYVEIAQAVVGLRPGQSAVVAPDHTDTARTARAGDRVGGLAVEDPRRHVDRVGIAGIDPDVASEVVPPPDGGPALAAVGGLVDHSPGHVELASVARLAGPDPTRQLRRRIHDVRRPRIDRETAKGDPHRLRDAVVLFDPRLACVRGLEDAADILGADPDRIVVVQIDGETEDGDDVAGFAGTRGDALVRGKPRLPAVRADVYAGLGVRHVHPVRIVGPHPHVVAQTTERTAGAHPG